jgi:NAD(P)H-hydrate epimerase
MSALAAMRTGAGYVTVGAPASLELSFTVRLLEAMMVGLPEAGGALSPEAVGPALKAIGRSDAVVLGPGLSKSPGAREFALELFERIDVPLVIDADGLNALDGVFPEDLPQRPWPTVLTPHAGELGRLLDRESSEVEAHRLSAAREAAERSGCVVLLKGDDTIVAAPGGPVVVSPGATPALATAGTGDVLAGIIGALLSKGLDPLEGAAAGTLAHARAGFAAAGRHGADHVIAGDVIDCIPAGMRRDPR